MFNITFKCLIHQTRACLCIGYSFHFSLVSFSLIKSKTVANTLLPSALSPPASSCCTDPLLVRSMSLEIISEDKHSKLMQWQLEPLHFSAVIFALLVTHQMGAQVNSQNNDHYTTISYLGPLSTAVEFFCKYTRTVFIWDLDAWH